MEILWKRTVSANMPNSEIRWNFGILLNESFFQFILLYDARNFITLQIKVCLSF